MDGALLGGDDKVAVLTSDAGKRAEVRDDQLVLLADEIRFEYATQKATALGHVVLTLAAPPAARRPALRVLADRLVYERRTGQFAAENVRLGSAPYFVEAFSARGTRAEVTLQRARVSYGEPGPWQPTWNADTIVYTADGRLRSENSRVGLGSAQPFPVPKFEQHLGQPLLLGAASFTGGYRRSLGLFADALLLAPVSPGVRAGADIGLFSSRGVMAGPAARYFDPENPARLRGSFRSGYINDHGDKAFDLLNRPVPEDRAYVEWQHEQVLSERLELKAQLNWWKDSEVLRDFRPRTFFPLQVPDTFAEATYAGGNYFVSAFARAQPNRFHAVQERLPEIRFDLLPTAIGGGLYERFEASAAVLREDPPQRTATFAGLTETIDEPRLHTTRLDAYYALERPWAPTPWFSFTPVAGARATYYSRTPQRVLFSTAMLSSGPVTTPHLVASAVDRGDYTRALGELGFDAALRTSGTFAYKNEAWKIDGLRHLFTPRLSYRYIPEGDRGRGRIPAIDREVFNTYLPPLGLGDQRNLDDLRATNTLRLGFDNLLQTRDAKDGTRDLVALNLANDFRFKRRPGERDVSEIHGELSVTPARWLQFQLYQSFAPQNFTLRELNSAITLRSGDVWTVRFSNNYLRRDLEDYLVDARVRLNESYEAVTRLHYDTRRHRFNEQAYGIAQNIGNTWLLSYTVSLYSGRRRESSFGFNVQIDTVRF
jgi:LPS-assembly protein